MYVWMIILKSVLKEIGWKDVEWVNLAGEKDECQAVLNTAVKLRAP
jgi:hypothetical protein